MFAGLNRVGGVILTFSLSVMREGKEGTKGRRGGKEGRSTGNKEHEEQTPRNKGERQGEHEHPNTKSQKNPPSTERTTPPLSKINHFGFANFLRVAIYNPISQHI